MDHFTADDGEKIHVRISGDGPPIIMLHGWTADHREWSPFVAELNLHHRVLRWDARGHGGHPIRNASSATVERMAQDLAQLIKHYRLAKPVVVGHSMGALTLWQYIRDFGTGEIYKVCFIDQSPKLQTDREWRLGIYGDFDEKRAHAFHDDLKQDFAESVLELIAFGLNQEAKDEYLANGIGTQKWRNWLRTLEAGPLINCWNTLVSADFRAVLPQIDIPSLLIYGEKSHFYLPETAEYVRQHTESSILHIYANANHSPHTCDKPRFLRDLLAFTFS